MNIPSAHRQNGAVLIIALVMLLALTLLATSSIRSTALDTRITGNRIGSLELQHLAESALREAEYRLLNYRDEADILEYSAANCSTDNIVTKFNRPCLLQNVKTQSQLNDLFKAPVQFLNNPDNQNDGAKTWMPYTGMVIGEKYKYEDGDPEAGWNVHLVEAPSPEYGSNTGISFFLVTGQADGQVAVQSTVAVVTLGDI